MKNPPKEKREKSKRILEEQKKFKEWEETPNFVY